MTPQQEQPPQTCSGCGGRRWSEDENWSPDNPATWKGERSHGDGLIPCGFCNEGGWDTPDYDRLEAATPSPSSGLDEPAEPGLLRGRVEQRLVPYYGPLGEAEPETHMRRCIACGRTSKIVPVADSADVAHELDCAVLAVLRDLSLSRAATPSPSSGLDVRKSYFGPYIHGLPGPAVILAVQGYQREPRRIVLPHQVYVETVEKLMAEPGVTEVWALPYRDAEWIRVDKVAAEYARLQQEPRP